MKTSIIINSGRMALGAAALSLALILPVTGYAAVTVTPGLLEQPFHITSCVAQPPSSCVTACGELDTQSLAMVCLKRCGIEAKGCMIVE